MSEKDDELKSVYDERGLIGIGDEFPKKESIDRANPVKRIFLGIVAGAAEYLNIYPKSFCPRCGHRQQRQKDGTSACPNCGMIVYQGRR